MSVLLEPSPRAEEAVILACRWLPSGEQRCVRTEGAYRLRASVCADVSFAAERRSRCSVFRGLPVASSQFSPGFAPQVGQGIANVSFGLLFMVGPSYEFETGKTVYSCSLHRNFQKDSLPTGGVSCPSTNVVTFGSTNSHYGS
jgi:hypothetical protein